MTSLILVRGLPGSGKSTFAVRKFPNHILVEADQFFVDPITRKYNYDPRKIAEAQLWCQTTTKNHLLHNRSVIVANTFSRLWEMQPYIDMTKGRCQLHVYHMKTSYQNIHHVPAKVINAMAARWERFPNERVISMKEAA